MWPPVGKLEGEEALGPHVKSGKQHPENCKPCAVLHPVEGGPRTSQEG